MKTIILTSFLTLAAFAQAADQKLEGSVTCAKCDLKTADQCHTVLVVTKDGKKDVYYTVENDKAKELHGEICTKAKPAVVEGTVGEKDGKKTLTITKFELKK
jgi:hypothetical protein